MKKKTLSIVMAVSLASISLTACGTGGKVRSSSPGASASPSGDKRGKTKCGAERNYHVDVYGLV